MSSKKKKPHRPPYFKIRLKPVRGDGWMDDRNLPDPRDTDMTRRFKTLPAAKKAFGKTSWGIPHTKKIVKVTRKGTETVHTSARVFKLGKKAASKKQPRLFQARIKYPAYFSKKDFFGSWHTVKATSAQEAVQKVLKGTTLSKKRVQVRRKK